MRLFRESGQLAAAERLIKGAAEDRRNDRTALLALLVPIYSEQGRIDEAKRFIEDRWQYLNARGEGSLEPAVKLLRDHIELTLKPTPVETIRAVFDQAAKLALDDDRVWLGRANLAIRTGRPSTMAARWLDQCQQRRPDDLAIWNARLSWGIAANRIDVVQQAMTHLEPAGAKQPEEAAKLRRKTAEIDELLARYLKLHDRKQPIRDAVEMARLARSRLGRDSERAVF